MNSGSLRPGAQTGSACFGLYVHVPFCAGKCPYCGFYSLRGSESRMNEYTECIVKRIKSQEDTSGLCADTLYFGGGTPSLLGAERIGRIVSAAQRAFGLKNAEITVEANPDSVSGGFFRGIREAGVNRISLGLQSADDGELELLGRGHTAAQAAKAVGDAQAAGFSNISLDLMLAVGGQTPESLARSVEFCAGLGVQHVSAYLLQIEPHTAYDKNRASLNLPDEDEAASLYLTACRELEERGFRQYEISNFAKEGFEGRHNLNYWRCGEYLGFGPSAHSFLGGKRFHYERSLSGYLRGEVPVQDGGGGNFEEFAMLKMRLAEGLTDAACRERYGFPVPERMKKAARLYEPRGLTACTADGFRFTPEGFLVSALLTPEILFAES